MNSTKDKMNNFLHAISELLPSQIIRRSKWIYYRYTGKSSLASKHDKLGFSQTNFENILNRKKKLVLVIDREIPTPDMDSGSFRMNEILKILSKKYEVIFLPADLQYNEEYSEMMRLIGVEILILRNYFETVEFFKTFGKHFTFVLISRPIVAKDYLPVTRKYCVNAKFIYDTVDLHYLRLQRESAFACDSEKKSIQRRSEKLKKIETQIFYSVDQIWVISNDEKEIVSKLTANVEVIPNIHPAVKNINKYNSTKDILFIGGFRHTPNVDAMKYFVSEIFPKIIKRVNNIKLIIIGSNPPQEILDLNSENILVKGYVKNLEMDFANARIFVSPVRFGAGMKGKIGLSLSYGIPTVSTTIGAEGFGFSGNELIIEDNPLKFAESVINLYNNEKEWKKYKTAGIDFMKRFTPEVVETLIFSNIKSVVGKRNNNYE
jgi:glycosyltransferase involved in cell wall biosynthesis